MASPEKFERFVSTARGEDTPTGGRAAKDKPLKTITAALAQLVKARDGNAGQRIKIKIESGTYQEELNLVNNLSLVGDDKRKLKENEIPSVRILRDKGASLQGTNDTTPPTAENVITIRGKNIEVVGLLIDGDGRPQRGISVTGASDVTIAGCRIFNCHAEIYHPKFKGTQADPLRESPVRHGKGSGLIIKDSTKISVAGCVFDQNGNKLTFRRRIFDSVAKKIRDDMNVIERAAMGSKLDEEQKKIEPIRDSSGGHVELERVDEISFVDSFFLNGFCTGRGGAIHAFKDAFFDVNRCTFRDNAAATDGGGVAINNEAFTNPTRKLITIANSVFDRNFAGDDGGGIYATSKTLLKIIGTFVSNNKANTNGGGVRITFGCEVTFEKSFVTFNENNVDFATKTTTNKDGGGGIAVNNSSVTLDNTVVEGNVTHGFAGAGIYFITAAYDFIAEQGAKRSHGQTFDDILKNPKKFNFKAASLVIKNGSVIKDNRTPDDTIYEDGTRKKGGSGSGLYVLLSVEINSGSTFIPNTAALGLPLNVDIDGSTFSNNQSEHRNDDEKAEIVVRGASFVRFAGETITKHPLNKFQYSFFKVPNKDMAGSTTFTAGITAGTVLDK